ncbi:MAG: hypothetical protein OXG19_00545 [Chloroflexi bacterium]|nr:hypothetical protein [Chloroflexota bacterium]
MERAAYRLLYDNIHDFKTTAAHVEAEIKRWNLKNESLAVVHDTGGRTHHDMWVSMKTVSHFNLGIALELMLKMILYLDNIPCEHIHSLVELHDSITEKSQAKLEIIFQESKRVFPNGFNLIAFINSATPDAERISRPEARELKTFRDFLVYFDEDVRLWEKRYSSELIGKGKWRHYIDDISVFIELIKRVMVAIPRC